MYSLWRRRGAEIPLVLLREILNAVLVYVAGLGDVLQQCVRPPKAHDLCFDLLPTRKVMNRCLRLGPDPLETTQDFSPRGFVLVK